jgi:purine catabolism regulator
MFPQSKYFRQSDLIVFIISMPEENREGLPEQLEQTFRRLQSRLKMVSPFTITLGIGQYYENIRDISKSYSEARVAINLGYSLQWFDRILFYNRLGLYRLLAPVMNSPEQITAPSAYPQGCFHID